ncbi:VPLPA-CTERM sorting domain-containing protein [Roseovarius phycicola]|uniref:VPLPA-CTERM sorting domain-containing protein n=1 Tax=Roseovarius phycicola TaxID=3080976 RepID=A0ABZ2HGB5_9RHOB
MNLIKETVKLASAGLTAVLITASTAGAITVANFSAEFDDADDLLRLSGDITSTFSTFNEIVFDWDGSLNNFDFSVASLLSSNIGGTLSAPAGGVSGGAFGVSGIVGQPLSAPLSFDFLVSIVGAGANFLSEQVDVGVCDDCTPGFIGGEVANDVGTPKRADLSAPAPVPLPAAAWMLIAALGSLFAIRKRAG